MKVYILTATVYAAWEETMSRRLSEAFGADSKVLPTFLGASKSGKRPDQQLYESDRRESLEGQLEVLEAILQEQDLLSAEVSLLRPAPPAPKPALNAPPTPTALGVPSRETLMSWSPLPAVSPERLPPSAAATSLNAAVFLVHGHDKAALNETARFLEKLVAKVIILHEQPSEGRTIIEKFTRYSDVDYAVVLLTPDDRGGSFNAPYEEQRTRARQNVIFELGFFL